MGDPFAAPPRSEPASMRGSGRGNDGPLPGGPMPGGPGAGGLPDLAEMRKLNDRRSQNMDVELPK